MFLLPHRYRGPSIFFTTRSVYHTNKKNARKIYTFLGVRPCILFAIVHAMELVGFEPTSKSSFITASPITFRILTFPQYHAYGQAGYISSFMNFPIPQSLSTRVSRWMIPDLKGTGNLKAGSCL